MLSVVILAGGFGERLWPASKSTFPKQFMTLKSGLSFFQQSLQRAAMLTCAEKNYVQDELPILVITRKSILSETIKHCTDFAASLNVDMRRSFLKKLLVIPEPASRYTTAPLALASMYVQALCRKTGIPETPILSLTSDHVIKPFTAFSEDVYRGVKQAENGRFVCFAIPPLEASTGFGYIKAGAYINSGVFKIDSFKEKPDAKTAQCYFKSGFYYWNSGMFCFLPSVFIQELKLHAPDIEQHFPENISCEKMEVVKIKGVKTLKTWPYMENSYKNVPSLPVDVAIAERTKNAYAVKTSFDWTDVGTWENFADLFRLEIENKDDVIDGIEVNRVPVAEEKTSNCFVYSDIPAVLCDVEDLIVVVKNGKLLIVKKGSSSMLKNDLIHNFVLELDKRE